MKMYTVKELKIIASDQRCSSGVNSFLDWLEAQEKEEWNKEEA